MATGLDFVLRLKDLLSPALQHAVRAGDMAGSKINSSFRNATGSTKFLNYSIEELREKLKEVERVRVGTVLKSEFDEATRSARRLKNEIKNLEGGGMDGKPGKGGGGLGMGGLIKGNLITMAISMASGYARDAIGGIVTGFANEQKNITGLKTFLGDAGAKEAYANIKKDAAVTPFDTESLLQSNRALISAGLNAKQARTDTMNLANAISAVGGGSAELSRMAANMQQVKTVGKATAMDIRQFAMAGINIYQLLADETGKSIAQVQKMDVTYDLLSRSLARAAGEGGAYYGAMAAQGQTLAGKWSTFMDNIKMGAAEIGMKLEPIISKIMDLAMGVTNSIGNWITYLQPVWDIINQIPDYISSIVNGTSEWSAYFEIAKEYGTALWATIVSLGKNIWNILSGLIEWIQKSNLIKDLFAGIMLFAQGVLWVVRGLGDGLVWIWDNVLKPILDGIEWIYTKVKGLLGGGKTEVTVVPKGVQNGPGGIVVPMPADTPKSGTGTGNKTGNLNLGDGAKDRSDAINGGGQRNITITIGKQIERMDIHVLDAKEGAQEIESMVREAMQRVMYSLNGVAV